MSKPSTGELEARITEYLAAGGLFNPELMEHEKVRDLLMDCREQLDVERELRKQLAAEREKVQMLVDSLQAVRFQCEPKWQTFVDAALAKAPQDWIRAEDNPGYNRHE